MSLQLAQNLSTNPTIARLQRGYAALFALVDDFPEARRDRPGACGEWSPRQTLAHLSGWLVEAAERFTAIRRGDRTNKQYDRDGDHAGFNHASVKARAGLSWEETVAELRQAFDAFIAVADTVPAEDVHNEPRYVEWLDFLWAECVAHMGQLSRFALE